MKIDNAPKAGSSRSRRKKQFEGYEFYRVPRDGKSGYKTIGVYTGNYYKFAGIHSKSVLRKILYAFLSLISIALFVWIGTRPYAYNQLWHMGVVQYAGLVAMAFQIVALVNYITAERQMTAYIYRISSRHLIKAAFVCAVLFGLCAVFAIFHYTKSGFAGFGQECLGWGGLLMCTAAMLAVSWLEKKTPYVCFKSQDVPPKGADKMID